jgi:hypothetical protein
MMDGGRADEEAPVARSSRRVHKFLPGHEERDVQKTQLITTELGEDDIATIEGRA